MDTFMNRDDCLAARFWLKSGESAQVQTLPNGNVVARRRQSTCGNMTTLNQSTLSDLPPDSLKHSIET